MDYFDDVPDVVEFVCEGCMVQFGDVPADNWTCEECEATHCGGSRISCRPVDTDGQKWCEVCVEDLRG